MGLSLFFLSRGPLSFFLLIQVFLLPEIKTTYKFKNKQEL